MSKRRRKIQKPFNQMKVPGDHRLRFFRDAKSQHPFMSISIHSNFIYGHEMTTHPSLNQKGLPRNYYVKFRRNPNPNNKTLSYYHRSIRRIKNTYTKKGYRFRRKTNWRISKKDLRILKRIDKKRIKNVRRADE